MVVRGVFAEFTRIIPDHVFAQRAPVARQVGAATGLCHAVRAALDLHTQPLGKKFADLALEFAPWFHIRFRFTKART